MISKTKITKKAKRKTNPELVETILLARTNHIKLANKISFPRRLQEKININDLNKFDGKNLMMVGKVLGEGDIDKKINISALSFSKQAEEKLKKAGCKIKTIKEELKENPKLEGVEIIYGKNNH